MTTFQTFDSLTLAYQEEGNGRPVVLLHGFASDTDHDWRLSGLWRVLVGAGHRVIGLDARGHGRSQKPHDSGAYADDAMSRDVVALFNHLGLEWADVVGYSMGAVIALRFTLSDPRVRRLVLGGNSGRAITQPDTPRSAERRRRIARALLAENPSTVDGSDGRDLRRFADDTRADRVALAAVQLAPNRYGTSSDLSMLRVPTLVICGDRDVSPDILASALPNAQAKVVPGSHIGAISSADFAEAVRDFLA